MANVTTSSTSTPTSNSLSKAMKDASRAGGNPLEQVSRDIGERAGEAVSHLTDSVQQYYQDGREFVKQNPVKGVAIAAAAGIVTGGLISMALRRNSHNTH